MHTRLLSFFLFCIIANVRSRNDFPNEVIVTSADVVGGKIENIGKPGESYRLYAVAAIGSDPSEVEQVVIFDRDGKSFTLNDLYGIDGAYFLSENNIVTGPVKVTDPTPTIQTRKRSVAYRLTYTIYLVSTKVPALPVADVVQSVSRMRLNSDDYKAQEKVRGMTVLSADAHFTLRQFQFTADAAYIIPRGYDLQSSSIKDSLIDLNLWTNAYTSYLTIFGPVATILNTDETVKGQFTIGFDPASTFGELDAEASLSLLSPNWLSTDTSYSTSFTSYREAFDRQFTFAEQSQLDFTASSMLHEGESLTIEIIYDEDVMKQFSYKGPINGAWSGSFTGRQLHLAVVVNSLTDPANYPRFAVKVTSNATVKDTTATAPVPTTSLACSGSILMTIILLIHVIML